MDSVRGVEESEAVTASPGDLKGPPIPDYPTDVAGRLRASLPTRAYVNVASLGPTVLAFGWDVAAMSRQAVGLGGRMARS